MTFPAFLSGVLIAVLSKPFVATANTLITRGRWQKHDTIDYGVSAFLRKR
jgi:hypothetical protein